MATFVTFMDTSPMSEADRFLAEKTYETSILAAVPSSILRDKIYRDSLVGGGEGLAHFESGQSAWYELDRSACSSVEKALGYWPGGAAHFEVNF